MLVVKWVRVLVLESALVVFGEWERGWVWESAKEWVPAWV